MSRLTRVFYGNAGDALYIPAHGLYTRATTVKTLFAALVILRFQTVGMERPRYKNRLQIGINSVFVLDTLTPATELVARGCLPITPGHFVYGPRIASLNIPDAIRAVKHLAPDVFVDDDN